LKDFEDRIEKYRSENPDTGLPLEDFHFVSRLTPIINVDLLIQDKIGRTLLAWRDDYDWEGKGWHLPGGIIRYKETFKERLQKVARDEVGIPLTFGEQPIAINEILYPQKTRGHSISLLYQCYFDEGITIKNVVQENEPGFLCWHKSVPDNFLDCQKMYRKYFNE
tara:strand:+ start:299 stop:793 length:495 start_codon:yes stop_codon:yes gene_type:complete